MKKTASIIMATALILGAFSGCAAKEKGFDESRPILVVSREEGSGTRGAFVELLEVEQKDASGKKIDYTTEEAQITNSTSVMMTTVAGDRYAIGYISLGSLNDTVKALEIDGAAATVENIKNGSYKISRPFNIAVKDDAGEAAKDFIGFILSAEGQAVIEKSGYISVLAAPAYSGNKPSGKVVVAGSSSVSPVMEKLKEAYVLINSGVTIEIQQSDSTTGMTSVINGICDIGMASRALKDSEIEKGLTATAIALDGIAIIVNNENPAVGFSSETVKNIFMGAAETWADAK